MPLQRWDFYNSKGVLLGYSNEYSKGIKEFETAKWCKYYENNHFKKEFFVNI